MINTENIPVKNNVREREIARLTTPIILKNGIAYDNENISVDSVETFSEFKHYLEPKPGILDDDEILKYARNSKAASLIRLERGIGDFHDFYMLNQRLPWIFGLYYVVVLCIAVPAISYGWPFSTITLLILAVLPLVYVFYKMNIKGYSTNTKSKEVPKKDVKTIPDKKISAESQGLASLRKYEVKVNDLKAIFDVKEKSVRELIAKRFEPPQITYDRFISSIDSCHKVFYSTADSTLNIIHLAADDTPRVEQEITNKISSLEEIIDQIEDLTNELVINISTDKNSNEDLKDVLNDMEDLVDSVKDY